MAPAKGGRLNAFKICNSDEITLAARVPMGELVSCPFNREGDDMTFMLRASLLLLAFLGCGWVRAAQVTIENPKKLPVKEEEVNLLYTMVCQQVAKDFHVRNYKNLESPLTLVLGEDRERYVIDHLTGAGTIYLHQWDEVHFASAAVMIAFHHVLSNNQFREEVKNVLTRFSKIVPETISAARNRR